MNASSAPGGRDLIHQGSRFMLLDNASKVVGPLLVLLCARLYAGGEWGFFKYYESVLLLLTRLATAGMDRGVVWIYEHRGGGDAFMRVFARAVNFTAVFAVVLALGAGAHWAGWLPVWSGISHDAPGATGFNIACYLAAVPFQAVTQLLLQALINKRRLMPLALVRNVAVPLLTLGPAALLALTPLKPNGLAVPYLLGNLAGFALALFFFLKAYPLRRGEWSASAKVPRDMVKFSLPLASTDFAMSLAYRVDILLLARFAGLEAVEVYSVIVMIANTLKSVRQSFDGVMLSVFSRGKAHGPAAQIHHYNYANWIVLSMQLPFLPLAMLFGSDLLTFVSPAYAAAGGLLALMIFFNLWSTLGAFSGQFVMGRGKTGIIPISQIGFFGVSLALNFLLIPRFGLWGAATATGIAGVVGAAIPVIGVWRLNRRNPFIGTYAAHTLIEVLLFMPAMLLAVYGRAGLPLRIAVFVMCAALFGAYVRSGWRRFNASLT